MFWVRATTSGVWRTVDVVDGMGYKMGEKLLVMANEEGRWSIDGRGVDVQPMMVVSFRNPDDAHYFINLRRAQYVAVEPNFAVAFESEADAMFFVNNGLADRMSNREVEQMFAEHRARMEGGAPELIDEADLEEHHEPEPAAKVEAPKTKATSRKKGRG